MNRGILCGTKLFFYATKGEMESSKLSLKWLGKNMKLFHFSHCFVRMNYGITLEKKWASALL